MVQHSKPTEDLDQAMDNIRKTRNQYMASVDKALNIAGYAPESIRRILNEITEHEQKVISLCQK